MEFSTEHWTNHRKGQLTRQEILEAIGGKGKQSIPDIAAYIGKSQRQTIRQIKALIAEGKIIRDDDKLILNVKNTYMCSEFKKIGA